MSINSKLHGLLSKTKFSYSTYLAIRNESSAATATLGQTVNNNNNTTVDEEYARAKPYSQIPAPHSWPIIGNTLFFANKEKLKNAADFHKKMFNEYGPIYKMKLPHQDILFITSAEDSQKLYSTEGKYPKISAFELFERVRKDQLKHLFSSPGLLSSGEDWHNFRSLVQQDMMRPKSALFYIDEMSDIMDDFIQKVESIVDEKREVDDITRSLYEFALDAIGVMFIGTKLNVIQGSEIGKTIVTKVNKSFDLFASAGAVPASIAKFVPVYKEYVQIMDDIGTLIMAKVKESIQKHKEDGSLEGSILGKLIEKCGYDSDVPLIMAADALAAGIDTTGNTAAFLLYHLATNPDKQEKLYQEIIQVIGKDGKMTEAALAEMRFLKACQQESMRLAPVAMGTTRTTCQDIVLSGYQVPKGIYVMRVGYLMQNNEEYFQQPDKFLPERWIRGCPQHQKLKNAYANIPFGHGPRACIGQRFAKLELYMVAFKLIQKYKISYDGPEIGIDYIGLGSPNLPLKLKFEKRN